MNPEKDRAVSVQTAGAGTPYKLSLDAQAEILQKEGAQKFKHYFLDYVHQHSPG